MDKGGFYYLLESGSIIWTKELTEPVGGIKRLWRGFAWQVVTEAMALGANQDDVDRLINKWAVGSDDEAQRYAEKNHLKLFKDGNQWCATFEDFENLQESDAGFGQTAFKALIALAKVAFEKKDAKSG